MLPPNNESSCRQAGQKLTNHARSALLRASAVARRFGGAKIGGVHLLYSIFLEKGSLGSNILADLGIRKGDFHNFLKDSSSVRDPERQNSPLLSFELKKIFTRAFALAKEFNYPYVGTEHLTYALLEADDKISKKIVTRSKIRKASRSLKAFFDPGNLSGISRMLNLPDLTFTKNKTAPASATPFVDKFCLNINEDAGMKKEVVIGREKEMGRFIDILGRKNKNNPLLVGDPGVGKTALVSGLAQLINSGQVPPALYKKRIMGLDVAQLVAGTSFRGEFEARLKEIIKETAENRDIILFIDEIHNIVGAGNVSGSLDLANILKPALARGELQLIGATTASEYKKHIEKDAALERRFQPIYVQEPDEEEAKKILFGIKTRYEIFHNVSIADEAVNLAVELSARYVQNRFLPDKAIDVIDEAAARARSREKISDFAKRIRELEDRKQKLLKEKEKLVTEENFEKAIHSRSLEKELANKIKILQEKNSRIEKEHPLGIGVSDIIETVARISGVSAEKLSQEKSIKTKNIKKTLLSRIVGQDEAIEKLSSALLRSQTGVSNPDRPLGSFLFLGPTGAGKTLTAQVLAQEFFGSGRSLARVDMSELMERHSVASLIGSPAGYVGYGEGGNLTEKIRRNPYSVVLFDEIEKAHPDVFNIMLQILEDGTLTDAEGTSVSFKNTIIILTSNLGTDDFTNAAPVGFEPGKSGEQAEKFNRIKDRVLAELQKKMRPELLNRLDYVLVFSALGRQEIQKIAILELDKLRSRLSRNGLELSFGKKLPAFIAEKSLAFSQGARLVRKNIQELVENPIAEMIMRDRVRSGKIAIDIENGKIKLT